MPSAGSKPKDEVSLLLSSDKSFSADELDLLSDPRDQNGMIRVRNVDAGVEVFIYHRWGVSECAVRYQLPLVAFDLFISPQHSAL